MPRIADHYIAPLLAAAHAFFDAPDRDTLLSSISLHTASVLGTLDAQVLTSTSRGTVSEDLALQLGLTEEFDDHSSDEFRHHLEPFYAASSAVASDDDGELAAAAADLFPGRQALVAALRTGSQFFGVLAALDSPGERTFSDDDRAVLAEIAAFAGQALRVEEIARDREARDGLTGLFDQAYLRRELRAELQRGPATLVMFDIDFFKKINDSSGHAAGDDVLRIVSAFVRHETRASDVAVRYGGEEFAILLVGADEDAGVRFAERLRQLIEEQKPGDWGKFDRQVTISAGVAAAGQGSDPQQLIETADAALYAAKRGGRNQVRRASESS
jgi:diguanylate cyclase (GGDEF)-like protein